MDRTRQASKGELCNPDFHNDQGHHAPPTYNRLLVVPLPLNQEPVLVQVAQVDKRKQSR